jgi:hypothetical protein
MRETSCNSLSSPLPLTVVQSFCAGGASCISRGTLNEPPFTQYVSGSIDTSFVPLPKATASGYWSTCAGQSCVRIYQFENGKNGTTHRKDDTIVKQSYMDKDSYSRNGPKFHTASRPSRKVQLRGRGLRSCCM